MGSETLGMTDSFLGSNPEFEKLHQEREFLCGRLGELSAERENCLHTEGPNLHSIYYEKVGHLEVACLKTEFECARIKREIELITAAVNSGKSWDYEAITVQLDKEFQEWQQRVAKEMRTMEEARERLSSLMKPEDAEKFQKLYRSLVKQLHPDVQPQRHPRLRPLWDRLQRAYQGSDIDEMELIQILIKDEKPVATPGSVEELSKEIESLTEKCKLLVTALFTLRQTFPFTLAELLSDPVALADKKKTFEGMLRSLAQRKTELSSHLNTLLDSRP
jgi:hypothetical protein